MKKRRLSDMKGKRKVMVTGPTLVNDARVALTKSPSSIAVAAALSRGTVATTTKSAPGKTTIGTQATTTSTYGRMDTGFKRRKRRCIKTTFSSEMLYSINYSHIYGCNYEIVSSSSSSATSSIKIARSTCRKKMITTKTKTKTGQNSLLLTEDNNKKCHSPVYVNSITCNHRKIQQQRHVGKVKQLKSTDNGNRKNHKNSNNKRVRRFNNSRDRLSTTLLTTSSSSLSSTLSSSSCYSPDMFAFVGCSADADGEQQLQKGAQQRLLIWREENETEGETDKVESEEAEGTEEFCYNSQLTQINSELWKQQQLQNNFGCSESVPVPSSSSLLSYESSVVSSNSTIHSSSAISSQKQQQIYDQKQLQCNDDHRIHHHGHHQSSSAGEDTEVVDDEIQESSDGGSCLLEDDGNEELFTDSYGSHSAQSLSRRNRTGRRRSGAGLRRRGAGCGCGGGLGCGCGWGRIGLCEKLAFLVREGYACATVPCSNDGPGGVAATVIGEDRKNSLRQVHNNQSNKGFSKDVSVGVSLNMDGGTTTAVAHTMSTTARFKRENHTSMARDRVRVRAYQWAIERRVPGKVVLEVGCGPFALFAINAARAGAAAVLACEAARRSAVDALHTVAIYGFPNVVVLHGYSKHIDIPASFHKLLVPLCARRWQLSGNNNYSSSLLHRQLSSGISMSSTCSDSFYNCSCSCCSNSSDPCSASTKKDNCDMRADGNSNNNCNSDTSSYSNSRDNSCKAQHNNNKSSFHSTVCHFKGNGDICSNNANSNSANSKNDNSNIANSNNSSSSSSVKNVSSYISSGTYSSMSSNAIATTNNACSNNGNANCRNIDNYSNYKDNNVNNSTQSDSSGVIKTSEIRRFVQNNHCSFASMIANDRISDHEDDQEQNNNKSSNNRIVERTYDLIIHEIIGDFVSNEGVADVILDIQTKLKYIPQSIPYSASSFVTPIMFPEVRHINFPHFKYPQRTIISPNRKLLQSVHLSYKDLLLCDYFLPFEILYFERSMKEQMQQKRTLDFEVSRSGKFECLLVTNEIEVCEGIKFGSLYTDAFNHWYSIVVLLPSSQVYVVSKGDKIRVHTHANLENYCDENGLGDDCEILDREEAVNSSTTYNEFRVETCTTENVRQVSKRKTTSRKLNSKKNKNQNCVGVGRKIYSRPSYSFKIEVHKKRQKIIYIDPIFIDYNEQCPHILK